MVYNIHAVNAKNNKLTWLYRRKGNVYLKGGREREREGECREVSHEMLRKTRGDCTQDLVIRHLNLTTWNVYYMYSRHDALSWHKELRFDLVTCPGTPGNPKPNFFFFLQDSSLSSLVGKLNK